MEGNNILKSTQLGLITFVTQTGVGIIMFPSVMAEVVGHDGWISLLITAVIVALFSMSTICLLRRYGNKVIYDINQLIFGKIAGTGINILLVVYLLTASMAGAGLFNYFIRITLLQATPSWVLAPFITIPSFYLVWQGLKHISRFLYVSLASYFIILIFLIFLYKEFKFSFLLPVGEAGAVRVLSGVKECFFAFLGFELIAFFYSGVGDKKNVLKWQMVAIAGSTIFFLVILVTCNIVFGQNLLSILTLPFFNISRIYNAPILERVDLYLTALWFIPTACSMRSYIFSAFDSLQKVFKLKKTKITYCLFFIGLFILSSLPKDINQILSLIDIINYAGIGVAVLFVLCLFLSFIRKKGVCVK